MNKKKVPTLKEIENNFSDWKSAPDRVQVIRNRNDQMREAKAAKINMRVSQADLDAFKKIAAEKGLGYQTLLGSVIHSYVTGRLVERKMQTVPAKTKKRA
jgi:predicted DNA binding CopG/RHH family protein